MQLSDNNQPQSAGPSAPGTVSEPGMKWSVIRRTQELWIFGFGILAVLVTVGWFLVVSQRSASEGGAILAMIGAHLTGGRALGIAMGLGNDLPKPQVIVLGFLIETSVVCVFFAFFSLSFKKLISARFRLLNEAMQQLHRSALQQRRRVWRWGVPGLLLFVWFPFFMTGPVVGAVIGFMLGMRAWVVVMTVLTGTLLALVSWTYVMDPVLTWTASVGEFIPLLIVLFLLVLAVAYRMRTLREALLTRLGMGTGTGGTTVSADADKSQDGPGTSLRSPGGKGGTLLLLIGMACLLSTGCSSLRPTIGLQIDVSQAPLGLPPFYLHAAATAIPLASARANRPDFAAYAQTFGAAAPEIENYISYWQNFYRRELAPAQRRLTASGRQSLAAGVYRQFEHYYRAENFTESVEYLHRALLNELKEQERRNLEQLLLTHTASEMFYRTVSEFKESLGTPEQLQVRLRQLDYLQRFRDDFGARLFPGYSAAAVGREEMLAGDAAAIEFARLAKDWKPIAALPLAWHVNPATDDDDDDDNAATAAGAARIAVPDYTRWPLVAINEASGKQLAKPGKGSKALWLAAEFAVPADFVEADAWCCLFWSVKVPFEVYVNGWLVGAITAEDLAQGSVRVIIPRDALLPEVEKQSLLVRTSEAINWRSAWQHVWLLAR